MKKILALVLITTFSTINSQEIFEFEKEIQHINDYHSQDFLINSSEENINISGTLISPKDDYKTIVIIVPGSGRDTRNSHYKLAASLLNNNIGVFRFDDRGTGKSEGKFNFVLFGITNKENDLLSIITYLRENTSKKIGVIGHSEGGMACIGAYEKGALLDFMIQWATPIEKHGEFLKYQVTTGVNTFDNELKYDNLQEKIEVMDYVHGKFEENKEILESNDNKVRFKALRNIFKAAKKIGYTRKRYDRFYYANMPAMVDLILKNFEKTYENINIPMYYVIGSKDKFVNAIDNTTILKGFNNELIEIDMFPNLNHYLTKEDIDVTEFNMSASFYEIDETVLTKMIAWIKLK